MQTIKTTPFRAAIVFLLICTSAGIVLSAAAGSSPPTDSIQATVEHDRLGGSWTVHASGTYRDTSKDVVLSETYIYGMDDSGTRLGVLDLDGEVHTDIPPSFSFSAPIPHPPLSWTRIGYGMYLHRANGTVQAIESDSFPIIWSKPVLIDHAVGTTVIAAPNFVPRSIPSGIGIPHTLINGLPVADYYAVVFFSGVHGCPDANYAIGAFLSGEVWGADSRGPAVMFNKAHSSTGGGCMQEFHVDPNKAGDWLWGALNNSTSSPALGDANGVPAFGICATREACDALTVRDTETPVEPPEATSTARMASSVLFLPGIKGSQLYTANPLCSFAASACDLQAWLPLADAFSQKLFLHTDGTSMERVYAKTDAILKSAFGYDFYDSFAKAMEEAQADGTYGEGWRWKAAAYDWRLSLDAITHRGAQSGDRLYYEDSAEIPYIEKTLQELASSSPSGKVTIVAHSNGGLVAKALLQHMGDAESARLVDSLVLVGVPQSGSPRAIGALLFGEGEQLPAGGIAKQLIMSAAHARAFALNSPMAYHLLPSAAYLALPNSLYPLVTFSGAAYAKEARTYGTTLDTVQKLKAYLKADAGDRTSPDPSDLQSAAIANAGLLNYAESAHETLDSWTPPQSIEVYQIAGFGADTIAGVDLYSQATKDGSSTRSYRPRFMHDGDGTVPIASALLMKSGQHIHDIWIDLHNLSTPGYSHANIMEMPFIQETLSSILDHEYVDPYTRGTRIFAAVQSITDHRLILMLHGNGTMFVRDEDGRYAGSRGTESGSDESEIPGSATGTLGNVTYVIVPSGSTYETRVHAIDPGTLSIDMEELDEGLVVATSTIAGIDATANTTATFTVFDSIASTSAVAIDTDGNGTEDASVHPVEGETVFPVLLSEQLETDHEAPVPGTSHIETHASSRGLSSHSSSSKPLAAPATISTASSTSSGSITSGTSVVSAVPSNQKNSLPVRVAEARPGKASQTEMSAADDMTVATTVLPEQATSTEMGSVKAAKPSSPTHHQSQESFWRKIWNFLKHIAGVVWTHV